mmetsp:Transcript_3511/g.13631  ORF Transcript_3511/g.13631 Transcript_3511/m.13631 type:complete len:150 (+) Transcript_3511:266-715(+)
MKPPSSWLVVSIVLHALLIPAPRRRPTLRVTSCFRRIAATREPAPSPLLSAASLPKRLFHRRELGGLVAMCSLLVSGMCLARRRRRGTPVCDEVAGELPFLAELRSFETRIEDHVDGLLRTLAADAATLPQPSLSDGDASSEASVDGEW